jgi:hypothetical protein
MPSTLQQMLSNQQRVKALSIRFRPVAEVPTGREGEHFPGRHKTLSWNAAAESDHLAFHDRPETTSLLEEAILGNLHDRLYTR